MRSLFRRTTAFSGLLVLTGISPAFAHHVMGGALPQNAWQGFLSGLGHPIIGLDHFAFIVGVGLMAQRSGRIALLPMVFVLGTLLGCWLHVAAFDLPWSEQIIVLSLIAAAALVAAQPRLPGFALAALFAASGIFHGYAYGESIVGAEPQPLLAYLTGFALIQYCLALASGFGLQLIVRRDYIAESLALRLGAGAIGAIAVFTFINLMQVP